MPLVLLNLLRNPYAIGAVVIAALIGFGAIKVHSLKLQLLNCESNFTQQRERWAQAEAEGQRAARQALEAAVRREREQAASRVLAEQEAASRLREQARSATEAASEWRQRYQDAVATDPDCEAWSRGRIQCPVR